jgi:hypothetical protein
MLMFSEKYTICCHQNAFYSVKNDSYCYWLYVINWVCYLNTVCEITFCVVCFVLIPHSFVLLTKFWIQGMLNVCMYVSLCMYL